MTVYLDQIPPKIFLEGVVGKMVHGDALTMAFWEIEAGRKIPEHAHPHEQMMIVQEGEFELVVSGHAQVYRKGMVGHIPSNTLHSGCSITKCKIIDIFTPVREDYQ